MAVIFANIGGNIGNIKLNIAKAIAAIGREFGPYEISRMVESDPWGFDSSNSFYNIGIAFQSEKNPYEILSVLQEIESRISATPHRDSEGGYKDREIDIDIIAIDDLKSDDKKLTLPHPCLAKRKFFLLPMIELAPEWRDPTTGLKPAEMLELLEKTESEEKKEVNE